jgi:hypothetical protein
MFSFLRFTAPRSSSSAIQLVQQLNLVRLLTDYYYLLMNKHGYDCVYVVVDCFRK